MEQAPADLTTSHEPSESPGTIEGTPILGASEPKTAGNAEQPPPELLVPQTPQTHITFLVISGRRRTMSFEPDTTIGRVKELVWNAWPTGDYPRFLRKHLPY